jgi:peptide/nickel transport system substrate-binding protein
MRSTESPFRRGRAARGLLRAALLGVAAALVVGAGPAGAASTRAASAGPGRASSGINRNGSLTVLENASVLGEWPTLDPATDTSDLADANYLDAIYGTLFDQARNGSLLPDLATGYKFLDGGLGFQITLRRGVTFTDGTPLDAQAVAYNITKDLEPQYACICRPNFPVSSVTTPNSSTVVLHLSRVYAPVEYAFTGEAPNWIASPTAVQKMGEQAFGLKPVGAGPFEVVSNIPSSKLVLKRNPGYWQKGHPYLKSLTFDVIGSDESAYEGLISGQAQAYNGYTSYTSLSSLHGVKVTALPSGAGPYNLQLNTTVSPFNNILAREAIYYATDPQAINRAITGGRGSVTQSITEPGGLYYDPKVPGYRTYDLAKAKALVKQLGGLTITLTTLRTSVSDDVVAALQSQWARAGIKTQLVEVTLPGIIEIFFANKWQAVMQNAGGLNPVLGNGLAFRYLSNSPFTGVHDPTLDHLAAEAASTLSYASQNQLYRKVWKYISDQAYGPVLFSAPAYNLTLASVHGFNNNGYQIIWPDVWVA